MEKEFIPYEPALALKELGFDEECFGLFVKDKSLLIKQMPNQQECEQYFGGILAPIFSQAFRWFREKHNLYHCICPSNTDNKAIKDKFFFELSFDNKLRRFSQDWYYHTYEEAELECLKKLIEIVKSKQE